jgi:hypothetical protein
MPFAPTNGGSMVNLRKPCLIHQPLHGIRPFGYVLHPDEKHYAMPTRC